jgi:hypothetical protein
MPPDIADIAPPIGPMVNDGRLPLIIADDRELKESEPPPPMREGIAAPNRPGKGAMTPDPIDGPGAPVIAP